EEGDGTTIESNEEAAREQFELGVELSREERWDEACRHFARAHELGATGGTRLRLADCYERQGRDEQARALYIELTQEPDATENPERAAIARERLMRIEAAAEEAPPADPVPQPPKTRPVPVKPEREAAPDTMVV